MTALMKMLRNIFVAAGLAAAAAVAVVHADVWSDLGTDEAAAKQQAIETVFRGYVPSIGSSAFKAAAPAARAAIVQRVAAWAKAYVQSPAFKTQYDKVRAGDRPGPPEATGSFSEQMKKQKEEFDKNVAEMRKNEAGQSQQVKDTIEAAIKQMQTQYDEMLKNSDYMKQMDQASAQHAVESQKRYASDLQQWDREHPASINQAVALRLHRFLDTCGAVDFNAQLVTKNGTKVFANPAYEAKDYDWKMCFRAGKEPVDAAKAFATAWLKEMGL